MTSISQIELASKILTKQLDRYSEIVEELSSDGKEDPIIKLNVGGTKIQTRLHTLTWPKGSYFQIMLSKFKEGKELDKEIFIDRNPSEFQSVLNYLRTKKITYMNDSLREAFEYYNISIPQVDEELHNLLSGKLEYLNNKVIKIRELFGTDGYFLKINKKYGDAAIYYIHTKKYDLKDYFPYFYHMDYEIVKDGYSFLGAIKIPQKEVLDRNPKLNSHVQDGVLQLKLGNRTSSFRTINISGELVKKVFVVHTDQYRTSENRAVNKEVDVDSSEVPCSILTGRDEKVFHKMLREEDLEEIPKPPYIMYKN